MEYDIDSMLIKQAIDKGSESISGFDIVVPSDNFHRDHYLGMSSISRCPRELFFKLNEVEEYAGIAPNAEQPISPNLHRVFRLGHLLEHELIAFMRAGGLEVSGQQLAFSEFQKFKGHCDGIVTIDGNSYIFDIKTMSQNSFDKFTSNLPLDVTFKAYFQQLTMYMYYANLKTKAFIVAFNKNTCEIEVRSFQYNEKLVAKIRKKALNIEAAKSVLHVLCDRSTENCTFCRYVPICDQVDIDLKS